MNVLVVGCGSIGRRHIHNLVKLGKVERVFVYTKSKDCFNALDNSSGKIEALKSLDTITPDFALICTQTHKHLGLAISLAKRGVDLFIEKPLAKSLGDALELKRIAARKKIRVAVGYNLRFLGAVKFVKDKLAAKDIGDLYFARIEVGQYLPDWRKSSDYRRSYSASRKKGGGVSLDLSHEIDYMRYLFGDPIEWKVMKARVSGLEIDSDDIFEGIYRYINNFVCSVHMDYLQPKKRRLTRIVGSKGVIILDLARMEIRIEKTGKKGSVIKEAKYFDLDKTYKDELKDFIVSAESGRAPRVTIDDGIKAVELIQDKNV